MYYFIFTTTCLFIDITCVLKVNVLLHIGVKCKHMHDSRSSEATG